MNSTYSKLNGLNNVPNEKRKNSRLYYLLPKFGWRKEKYTEEEDVPKPETAAELQGNGAIPEDFVKSYPSVANDVVNAEANELISKDKEQNLAAAREAAKDAVFLRTSAIYNVPKGSKRELDVKVTPTSYDPKKRRMINPFKISD